MKKDNKVGGLTLPDFKIYCKATWMKMVCHATAIKTDTQTNRTESHEVNPQVYGQMIFGKGAKTIKEKRAVFFNKWCSENWIISHVQNNEVGPYLKPYRTIKIDKRANCKTKIIRFLEENMGELNDMGLAMISWLWHQRNRQQEKIQANWTSSI